MMKKQAAYIKGIQAEQSAARYLTRQGFDVLEERFKTKHGEIDLIALKDNQLIFVEVKARKTYEDAVEAVTPKTRQRIESAALYFLQLNPSYNECDMRFDIIVVNPPFSIHHLDNAWRPDQ